MSLAVDLRMALDPVQVFQEAFGNPALDWQLVSLRESRNATVLKGRQVGASQSAAALAIHTAMYKANSLSVIVSPTQKQSKNVADRSREGIQNLGIPLAGDSATMLKFKNGSRILSLPGTPTAVRGYSADLLVLDECAFIGESTIQAALPVVAATGGRILVQSTPYAEVGFYYDSIRDADPTWAHFRVRSDEVPTFDPELLEFYRRKYAPDFFAREFMCEFGRTGASLFSLERLNGLVLPA